MDEETQTPAPAHPWAPGTPVGRYTLLLKLATGGMAEIWLARQTGVQGFEKVVVVKRLIDSFAEDEEFVRMFLDEARIAAQLSHPNVVQIYDLGQEKSAYYIAMEYLAGETIAAIVRAGVLAGKPLPITFAVRLCAAAAEGLGYAHGQRDFAGNPLQIVHRDVSPQNLIVTYDGVLKVVDFGIAKAANRLTQTSGGQLKGKIAYMSPEQARGRAVDARSDLFSLGVVLFEAVTGKRLLPRDDAMAALDRLLHSSEPFPRARAVAGKVPPALDAIIAQSIERDPQARFQTAQEFQAALEEWLRRREDAPGSAQIATYLRALFEKRIRDRQQLIEAARAGDAEAAKAPRAATADEPSMPGSGASPRKRWPWVLALSAALGVAVLAGAAGLHFATRADEPVPEPAVSAPAPSRLKIATDPPNAQVTVDGVARGASPIEVAGLELGKHEVTAKLDGFRPLSRPITLENEGATVEVFLPLSPVPLPIPVPEPIAVVPVAAPEPARSGFLTFDTSPWTQVFLGGRKLGDTPLVRKAVPAGTLKLLLRNEEAGVKQTIEVEVAPGKTTVKRLQL